MSDQTQPRIVVYRTAITGGDNRVVTTALLYAVALIQSLPVKRQDPSEMSDMLRILRDRVPRGPLLERMARDVHRRTGKKINLHADSEADTEPA